jgi:peptidoglycan hydrolase CwlO-like protein
MEDKMAFEDIKAAIDALMNEIVARPEDRHVLQEQLREKISELRALGLPVPADLKQFEDALSDENGDDDDDFDNMPV